MQKILILDRDGVINEDSDAFIKNADEFVPIPGSIEALVRLYQAGWLLAIATNQSGLARAKLTADDLEAIHEKLLGLLRAQGGDLHYIAWCPHAPDAACACRKPLPGLIHQIEKALHIDAAQAIFVGDAERDLIAGLTAGCKQVVLVRTGKGKKTLAAGLNIPPKWQEKISLVDDLAQLAQQLFR